ncbi:VOC family protein [Deinococcus radiopugnans]|uniref:VOC family protein n=1 Tax=Deinococcus radiopugnans TaxID=57497 RepID=UPI00361C7DE3
MSSTDLQLTGIHHLTAVSADIRENKRFYTQDLGMRLVKRSVNQDDVSAYHLFYADKVGTPGTDLTFFDWPVGREGRGAAASPAPPCASGTSRACATGRSVSSTWGLRTARSPNSTGGPP